MENQGILLPGALLETKCWDAALSQVKSVRMRGQRPEG